ncbi:MAG: hypothetical protein WCB27_03120 [Thermoguttaceae bacterium]
MPVQCPQCRTTVAQSKNRDGPNFCENCFCLFYAAEEPKMPPWVLGVLVILVANLQIIGQ